jgi:hypothetical protein
MGKIKLVLSSLSISLLFGLSLFVQPVSAIAPQVSISEPGEYVNYNLFNLSYSALSDDPGAITAQFYFRKESGSYAAFGPVFSGASGQVSVGSDQVNDQTKYFFKVEINGGVALDETNVIYDPGAPGPVQNYWKEKVAPGLYRLHWKNPSETDSQRVFIYRSDETSFEADGSHKVGEVGGTPNVEMTWENSTPDSTKEYYYALRVVDKAGNASGLVTDAPGTVSSSSVLGTSTASSNAGTEATQLPKEEVLAGVSDVTSTPTPAPTKFENAVNEVTKALENGNGKGGLVIAIIGVLLVASSLLYYRRLKKNN